MPLFFYNIDLSELSRHEAAILFYRHFGERKDRMVKELEAHSGNMLAERALPIVEETTIIHAHQLAEQEFDRYSRDLGGNYPRSSEYKKLEKAADAWSKAEQIAKEAVEIDFRERS